ncbi:MAG TPA: two-component regulator propeller domain-containing protein [Acidobacteriota bacterium]|nr:two-component regulator propeller domain-containing protein [Acidobacteriota bacterium]
MGLWILLFVVSPGTQLWAKSDSSVPTRHFSLIRNWQVEDGLPQNTILRILQSQDGYVWFVTFGGLVRFDGVTFTTFNTENTPGFLSNRLIALYESHDKSLWISTELGGLMQFKDRQWRIYTHADGLPDGGINTVAEDQFGALVVGTEKGLMKLENNRFRPVSRPDGTGIPQINTLLRDGNRLWAGTAAGLYRIENNQVEFESSIPPIQVTTLLLDQEGHLWVGGFDELIHRSPLGEIQRLVPPGRQHPTFRWISHVIQTRSGILWAATDLGLFQIQKHLTEYRLVFTETVPQLNVLSLMEDHEGTLWAGSSGNGLFSFRNGVVSAYTATDGISDQEIKTVGGDRRGNIWVGVGDQLKWIAPDKQISALPLPDNLKVSDIFALCEDLETNLWIGTAQGVLRFKDGRFTRFTEADGLSNNNVNAISLGPTGTLWVGTWRGFSRWDNGRFVSFIPNETIAGNWIRSILETPDGTIWLATDNGLTQFQNGRFTRFTTRDGLSDNLTRSLFLDNDGTVWVGTYGGGLNRLKDSRFTQFTPSNGLFDNVVSAIFEDSDGSFWLSGNRGICRVSKRELNDYADGKRTLISSVGYDKADGMAVSETNGGFQPAGWKATDGTLWFPTLRGVVSVDPGKLNRVPPVVRIERLTIDGTSRLPQDHLMFEPGQTKSVEIHYTGLSFAVPSKVKFRYQLEGWDPTWVEAGTRRTAYFTSLPPGNYRFRVVACNNDSIWNETGATLTFTIKPRFYQTTWFYAGCGLTLFGFGLGIQALRVRQIRRRAEILERIVRQRTETLRQEKEKTEVARLEADIQRRAAEAADHLKTELLSIAAHDLKSPLYTIKGFASITQDTLQHIDQARQCDEYLSFIDSESQRLLNLINALLDMAALESGKVRLEKKQVDLSTLVKSAISTFQPQAAAKHQTLNVTTTGHCQIEGDAERLSQVLENLLSNAIKFTPPGKEIEIALECCAHLVRTSIKDAGPGLTADDQTRLFTRFQRLSARPTGGESSTGLGLSIVKDLIELHGGRVGAKNHPHGGSIFWFELPRGMKNEE